MPVSTSTNFGPLLKAFWPHPNPGSPTPLPMVDRPCRRAASTTIHCELCLRRSGKTDQSRSNINRSPATILAGDGSHHTRSPSTGFGGILAPFPSGASPADDADWNELVTLEIGPHPDLSEGQKRIIALDYGMRGGRAQIQVRKALRYYALRRLGLDTPPEARRPQDQQIVLLHEGGDGENYR
jgi:hypothetical protein